MPKQVIIQSSIEAVEIIDTPIPTPQAKDVVIKVAVSGTNPKDWKMPFWKDLPHNSGDDIAGIVHSVGKYVYEFKPGDRVGALHAYMEDNGSFAEYAVAPDWTTFHLPPNVSFEEAATIPVCALTAAIGLYIDMKIPAPYNLPEPDGEKRPILIYGITSGVGAFAAKLARLSGMGPIIGVAGRAAEFASSLADYVVDYRNGEDAIVAGIEQALTKEGLGTKLPYIFDTISEGGSLDTTLRVIDPNAGTVVMVLPWKLFAKDKDFAFPPGVKTLNAILPRAVSSDKDFGYVWSRYLGRLLAEGRLKGHPYEVIPGGLYGVLKGLHNLRDGKASAVKYVYRIEDTKAGPIGMVGVDGKPAGKQSVREPHPLRNFPFAAED